MPQHEYAGIERDGDLNATWSGALHGSTDDEATRTKGHNVCGYCGSGRLNCTYVLLNVGIKVQQ